MRPRVVVVVPLSQSETCPACALQNEPSPICSECGRLKELPEGLNHFSLLGIEPAWLIDEKALRDRYLKLSALVHPDRYEADGPPNSARALKWSTAVNRAYQALKDRSERTRYLFQIYGMDLSEKAAALPQDLAEAYFDAQEGGVSELTEFKSRIERLMSECESRWRALAERWPTRDPQSVLRPLFENAQRAKYLQSMLGDLEKRLGVGEL